MKRWHHPLGSSLMQPSDAWHKQMSQMGENSRKWRAENPDKEVKIQFNYPDKIAVIGAIGDAIKAGYVSTNEAGMELINWPMDDFRRAPTVIMVRAILEHPL